MAEDVKQTPEVRVEGQVARQPSIGAYSASSGTSYARDIANKTPYVLSEKKKQPDVMDANNRWLKELGITSASPLDFEKAWQTNSQKQEKSEYEWRDTYGGKLAIRSFSRGIIGSIFFTAGLHMVGSTLKNYSYNHLDESKNSKLTNIMTYAARLIDKTIGKAYYKAALVIHKGDTKEALKFVTFRDTNTWAGYKDDAGKQAYGRSFGHEGMGITFDFGMASLGDYLGREVAALLDPNTEKKWMKDGKIDIPAALKATLKSVWIGTTKAMGEDYFAMAVGYPYVVKGSRNLINKFSPGFKYDSDRWANGGSFKIDEKGNIIGNYQMEGMADLGMRFTAYNVFTKIYRDGYDKAASAFNHFWGGDRTIHMPHFETPPTPENLFKKAVDGVKNSVKYLARTTIKMVVVMIPSSSVFAFIRASQSKDMGLAINEELGPVGVKNRGDGEWSPLFNNGAVKSADGKRLNSSLVNESDIIFKNGQRANFDQFISKKAGYERRFDPYGQKVAPLDGATNIVGRYCHDAGHALTEFLKPTAHKIGIKDNGAISKHVQRYVDATLAYTPYFMVKTDLLSTAYDTPRMDMAIDRALSGMAHLNYTEFKAGWSEVLHTILNRAFIDPDREKLAQKKMRTYTNQLWSSQDEILAKEKEEEFQERLDAQLSLGKPVSMQELYRRPFTEKLGRKPSEATNDPFYAQNITPMKPKTPEEYKKQDSQGWKKQANGSWQDTVRDFHDATSSQGRTTH